MESLCSEAFCLGSAICLVWYNQDGICIIYMFEKKKKEKFFGGQERRERMSWNSPPLYGSSGAQTRLVAGTLSLSLTAAPGACSHGAERWPLA